MRYLTMRHMAAEMDRSLGWFHRHWRGLVADRVIPPPLPGTGHRRWDRAELDEWRAAMAATRRRPAFGDQGQQAIEDQLLDNIRRVMAGDDEAA